MTIPSPIGATSPQASAPDGARKFGGTPVFGLVTLTVIAVAGVALNVVTRNRIVSAMCGNDRMGPGDTCETTRNGISTGIRTYTEVLATAQRINQVLQWAGIALVVIGILFAVLTVLRWRQDVQTRAQLTNEHGAPISAHSKTAAGSAFAVLFGAGFLGAMAYCVLAGLSRQEWGWFVGAAIAGVVGLGLLWFAIPKNGQLVQVFNDGLRVVKDRVVTDIAWRDVDFQIVPAKNAVNYFVSGGALKGSLGLNPLTDDEVLRQSALERSVKAKFGPAIDGINRGETVPFGVLSLSREGIHSSNKVLPWGEYAGIALKQGMVTVARQPKGKLVSTNLGSVRNYSLLVHVIDAIQKQRPQTDTAV